MARTWVYELAFLVAPCAVPAWHLYRTWVVSGTHLGRTWVVPGSYLGLGRWGQVRCTPLWALTNLLVTCLSFVCYLLFICLFFFCWLFVIFLFAIFLIASCWPHVNIVLTPCCRIAVFGFADLLSQGLANV